MNAIGHWGTGDLEIKILKVADVEQALRLIAQACEGQS